MNEAVPRVWSGLCSKRGTGLWRVPVVWRGVGRPLRHVPPEEKVRAAGFPCDSAASHFACSPRRREEVKLCLPAGQYVFCVVQVMVSSC